MVKGNMLNQVEKYFFGNVDGGKKLSKKIIQHNIH